MRTTPLYQQHIDLGAHMSEFAGWNMPIQYTSMIQEHTHTRTKCSLFDICHMGEFFISGETACNDIERLITCKCNDMEIGRCRYGFMLNKEGKIIDDLIAFKTASDEFMLVVNASRISKDKEWVKFYISAKTQFDDLSERTAKLDLQGPLSAEVLSKYTNAEIDKIKKYHFIVADVCGVQTLISRTGYTGELGFELYFSKDEAPTIWNELLKNEAVKPAGLGARDMLRLEMGYSLYGSDIDEERTPIEANLEKFIYFEKNFIGKEHLLDQKANGTAQILVGFETDGRRAPRHGFMVVCEGKQVGKVTSASFSPCLKKGIGLCYINKDAASEGKKITLADNKIAIEAIIKKPPFIKKT